MQPSMHTQKPCILLKCGMACCIRLQQPTLTGTNGKEATHITLVTIKVADPNCKLLQTMGLFIGRVCDLLTWLALFHPGSMTCFGLQHLYEREVRRGKYCLIGSQYYIHTLTPLPPPLPPTRVFSTVYSVYKEMVQNYLISSISLHVHVLYLFCAPIWVASYSRTRAIRRHALFKWDSPEHAHCFFN